VWAVFCFTIFVFGNLIPETCHSCAGRNRVCNVIARSPLGDVAIYYYWRLPRFARNDKKNVTPATEPGPRLVDVAPMARGLLYLDPGSASHTQRVARGPIARDDKKKVRGQVDCRTSFAMTKRKSAGRLNQTQQADAQTRRNYRHRR
jgi:hypothetical protein